MSFDLILRGARLRDGRLVDLGLSAGRIAAIEPQLPEGIAPEYLCHGHLVSPSFVDAHFHLDSALTLGGRENRSGTLLEGIQLWSKIKPDLTEESIIERALRYCDLAVSQGLLSIRSHVDVCDDRLTAVRALLHVKKQVAPYIDLQLVAFPQDGYLRSPSAKKNLKAALDLGVEVVGGIPHAERTRAQGDESLDQLLRLAADRGLRVDIHCDETDDPESRHVEVLAERTVHYGLQGRVTGSHLTSMHSMPGAYVDKLIPLMAEAQLGVVSNPLINMTLQGRFDTYPKRRGLTRVPELLQAGLPVAFGQDCMGDPWYPFGSADLLEVAHMGLHACQMTNATDLQHVFEAITTHPAHILGLEDRGVAVGCFADLVVLQAHSVKDALRLRAPRLAVLRRGRLLAERPPSESRLYLEGRPPVLSSAMEAAR